MRGIAAAILGAISAAIIGSAIYQLLSGTDKTPTHALLLVLVIGGIIGVSALMLCIPSAFWKALPNWYRFKGPSIIHLQQVISAWRFTPTVISKELQTNYRVIDGKVEICVLYFTIEMNAKYPYGNTFLRLLNSQVLVWQKHLGATGRPYIFLPINKPNDSIADRTNIAISRGKPFTYQVDYEFSIGNQQDEAYYPDLHKEFHWRLGPISSNVHGRAGAWFDFRVHDLKGVYNGPK